MTSVSGRYIVATPCCRALYTTPAYRSLNLSAMEYWTDGRRVNGLSPNDGGLRVCKCGQFYLLKDTTNIEFIENQKPVAPEGWENIKENWWTRFRKKQTKAQIMAFYDTRPIEVINAESAAIPQHTVFVKDEDLPSVIDQCYGEREILIIARRRYWQSLNDPFRDVYRKHREKHPDGFPDFVPNTTQVENMYSLLDLLLVMEQKPDEFEVIELFRELGNFYEAGVRLDRAENKSDRIHEVLSELMNRKLSTPARFRY